MTYNEAVKYLLNIPKFSKKTSKENLAEILNRLGNPQDKIKVVHVAGTNGKGSVCAFLNSMLLGAGKTVGMFTSPHLVRMNERMRINGGVVGDEEFLAVFEKVRLQIEKMEPEGYVHPSFFEFLFIMAATLFSERQLEYGIFEVGLGGRLDATNIIKSPIVSVITSISLDHTEILGDTIEKIAKEKAGIIKPEVPVVYYQSSKETADVIEEIAKEKKTECYVLQDEEIKINEISSKYVDFSLDNRYYSCVNVRVDFPAVYQAVNCALALIAFQVIKGKDMTIRTEKPERYAALTRWEGRMEQVRPNVFLDGAHNLSGIKEFLAAAEQMECSGRKLLLFSVVVEKEYHEMIRLLTEHQLWQKIFVAQMENARTVSREELAEVFHQKTKTEISVFGHVREAFERAMEEKKDEDLLFCAGSLYLVGELKEYLEVYND
ncbi:MAG: folylpolyglutamate synthase/dihydrofolate synthase family protein [Lachnospiraceae bacterium]|nr:folylpolyglutamate synthase/dihydrofolate synthase family protein [Lachnospiraceae bacterium]